MLHVYGLEIPKIWDARRHAATAGCYVYHCQLDLEFCVASIAGPRLHPGAHVQLGARSINTLHRLTQLKTTEKKTAELERFIYDIFRRDKKGSRTPCRPYWRNVKKSRRKRTVMQVHSKYSNRKERITEFVGMNKTPYFMIHLSST